MKFSAAAASFALALLGSGTSRAFVAPPFPLSPSCTALSASAADPYGHVFDAISSAADAATAAATTSAQLAASLRPPNVDVRDALSSAAAATSAQLAASLHPPDVHLDHVATALMTPEAIATSQARLSVLEANLVASSDPAAMSRAIADALDASRAAAEHALSATSVLTSNLEHFDAVLAGSVSMALHPALRAEAAQAQLALLAHNLSGGSVDAAFLANFLAEVDRQLDALTASAAGSDVSASAVLAYGAAALVLAQSQRSAGVRGYKKELAILLANGELDVDALAKDLGLPTKEAVETATAIDQLEDPAIAMAAIANEEPLVSTANKEVPLEDPVTTMAAIANAEPSVKIPAKVHAEEARRVEAQPTAPVAAAGPASHVAAAAPAAVPRPPAKDVPVPTLLRAASASGTEETPAVAAESAAKDAPPVVAADARTAARAAPGPTASPLARLFAQELGLDLTALGRGSGKNGKVLIDDVRRYQARTEEAQNALGNGAYFATAV